MKICILTTSFPRYAGDLAGIFVYDLATWLIKQGVEVEVVAPYEAGTRKRETMGGITVHRFAYMFPSRWQRIAYLGGIPSNLRRYRLAWLQLPFFLLAFLVAAARACRRCDIIHAYWIFAGFVASLISRVTSKPSVLTVQGSDVNLRFHNPWLRRFRAHVVSRMSRIIAVSSPLVERVQALGAKSDRVVLIPNGVDTATFACNGSDNSFHHRLLWVGRISAEKGVAYLIEALAQAATTFPKVSLTLVGDGPLREDITRLISELSLDQFVHMPGMVTHDEIPAYLDQSDIFVLPSLSEGLPLVLVEAMSAGKPVVATCVGGIPDVMVGEGAEQTGCLVPPADAPALAQAIGSLLSNPQRARIMGQNGRKRVEQIYAWPTIAKQTADLYRSLLGG